ncbi:MAG: bidirectional hydrogenase complex protein HoxU [Desulfobulbus sp.]|jgi:bidirectional [NiFe] hydrogenase diaphorase subunit|nr:bidirectional hydrogenase complex protein HoxU [Desulfobulbus sp.]
MSITLTIDGKPVNGLASQTILQVSAKNDIHIPTLCYQEGLSSPGSCRLCMVEVVGNGKLLPACLTPIQDGMEVTTRSTRLDRYRRQIIELLMAERNHPCAVCVANGHCELQELAVAFGVDHLAFPPLYPPLPVDASHDRFILDHNRCILCTRCVRICDEIEGAHTWDVRNRGIRSLIVADLDTPWGESTTCTSCGKCVAVCPTGALLEKGRSVVELHRRRPALASLVASRLTEGQ